MKKIFVLVCVLLGFTLSAGVSFGAPAITSPAPGTKLTDTTVTFSWDADGYTYFQLYAADHLAPYQSETITDTSITLTGGPNDGSPVFVILNYWDGVEWKAINYFYQAPGSGAKLPLLTSPSPGTELKSPTQTFQWDFGNYKVDNWTSFDLTIGSAPLDADIFDSGTTGNNTFTVNNLPQDNSTLYVTLWYWDGIEFKNIEYTYVSKKFPWDMFLPAFTKKNACTQEKLVNCTSIDSCVENNGYWYDNVCNNNKYIGSNKYYIISSPNIINYKSGHYINYSGSLQGNFQTKVDRYTCTNQNIDTIGTGKMFVSESPYYNASLPPLIQQTNIITIGSFSSSVDIGISQSDTGTKSLHYTSEEDYYINYPNGVTSLKSPLYIGSAWAYTYPEEVIGTQYKGNFKVTSIERINTPIGSFQCYKIQYNYSKSFLTGYSESGYIWVYPNIGVIKSEITVVDQYNVNAPCKHTYNLQYTITGTNLFKNNFPMN
ncbi:MAG TPA: hypothetical protein DIT39_00325 [Tissierellales bacterium]|nr:hypothetical protein [Tissierellales bacterium]